MLNEVTLDARPGQIIAMLGATGSGKSTIINLIPRFYDVTHGRITVDGVGSYTIFDVENDFNLNALTVANGAGLLKAGGLHIDNPSSVFVSNSTFVGNRAASGGHLRPGAGHLPAIYPPGAPLAI